MDDRPHNTRHRSQQLDLLETIEPAEESPVINNLGTGKVFRGVTQLSLVEHALCPLDPKESLTRGMVYDNHYFRYTSGRAERIDVEVTAGHGLSAADELLLWGLFALVCFDQDAGFTYHATPHYVMRRLGLSNQSKGGKNYRDFRGTMKRLGALSLYCQKFYDPEFKEDREVMLRFVAGNLPLGNDSKRVWRFNFDPQLLSLLRHKNGGMRFDIDTFRELGLAERRAFLPLSKIFYRRRTSPDYDLRHFCVNVLGYSDALPTFRLKEKLNRVLTNLLAVGIIELPAGTTTIAKLYQKRGTGDYRFRLTRGPYYNKPEPVSVAKRSWKDTPLYDPIKAIGFEDRDVRWFLTTYDRHILQVWADITLAAMEGQAKKFPGFQKNPKAYFRFHVKEHAAKRILGEPDWYIDFRKEEKRQQWERDRDASSAMEAASQRAYQVARNEKLAELVRTDRDGFERLVKSMADLYGVGRKVDNATGQHLIQEAKDRFLADHNFPDYDVWRSRQFFDFTEPSEN